MNDDADMGIEELAHEEHALREAEGPSIAIGRGKEPTRLAGAAPRSVLGPIAAKTSVDRRWSRSRGRFGTRRQLGRALPAIGLGRRT
jgi:hypothetical protein